ncbi:MAG: YbjN domain-containing protein [Corynebacterium sp.]|nr:YbjN domain-containing protein [Corynebacterium sp.]
MTDIVKEVISVFEEQNLQYRYTDGENVVFTGFTNGRYAFAWEESINALVLDASWRGMVETSSAPMALAATNEWNSHRITPNAYFGESPVENEGTKILFGARRVYHLPQDAEATHQMIGAFIMSSIETTQQYFAWLATQFPASVTWEEHNHG